MTKVARIVQGTVTTLLFATAMNVLSADNATTPADRSSPRLAPIVITPTRVEQSSFDLPLSIDVIDADTARSGQPQVNLSETLVRVPGIVAQNRQNYAQDLQISSRGFGARSTFGVRGIRLFADGIPATSPDGQGQAATFDLSTARRIEVLRGPFSTLYGNSSAGVIAVLTEDGPSAPTITADGFVGSFDSHKTGLKFGTDTGPFNLVGHASRFETDGYREHSATTRDQLNTKTRYALSDDSSLTFVAAALHQPDTQDPLGLTRAQVESNPRAAGNNALLFNTRKSIQHDQEGLIFESHLSSAMTLRVLGYAGDRDVTQFLAIPLATQTGARHSGGVVDLDRKFHGADVRLTRQTELLGGPLTLTGGIAYDNQEERRRGFINNNGTVGDLKRDEDDRVHNVDEYVQGEWRFAEPWRALLGVRHSVVRFRSRDHFITGTNPDDSGEVTFRATNPVAGVIYAASSRTNLYANFGRGFETPTFAELAYRSDGVSGLNFALQPSTSNNYEIGLKRLVGTSARFNMALFHVDTKNEIVVASNAGGRSTFQNAGRTERDGVEALFETQLGRGFGTYVAFSYIDAKYTEPFSACTSPPPCTVPTTIAAGKRIPGVPRYTAYGEVSWKESAFGFETALEARWNGKVYVNDGNTEAAPSYAVANWRAGFAQRNARYELSEYVRVDNLFDRRYIGSVIVNASGGQYYEPAPERNYSFGLRLLYRF